MEQIEEFVNIRLEYIDKLMKDRIKIDYNKIIYYIKKFTLSSLNLSKLL